MNLITVIVPIYNLDAYLYQCVKSILEQTYKHLEIILVDDGSTDNALEICEYFRKLDSRVTLIAKPNGGLVSARKAGLNISTGKYVFYVDGDDWISNDCIEQYHELACAYDADIVVGDYNRELLGNFVTVRNLIEPGFYDRAQIEQYILPRMISSGDFFSHGLKTYSWGKLYKRSVILDLQNQIPDEVMLAEDAALIYPAVFNSQKVYISDITACNYRQRPNSILKSTNFDINEFNRIAVAFQYLANFFKLSDDKYCLLRQLQSYFFALVTIRSGGFLGSINFYQKIKIFGDIAPGSNLAIYNSGSFGQHVYKQLRKNEFFKLVGWFDVDYKENNILNMNVDNPQDIYKYDFDYLLVPSFDRELSLQAAALLSKYKIDHSKIRTVAIDVNLLPEMIKLIGYDPTTFFLIK